MQPGVEVDWESMTLGKPYIVTLLDPKEAAVKGRLLSKTDTSASFDYSVVDRDEVAHIYVPKTKATAFVKKLGPVSVGKKLPHELTAKLLEMGTGKTPKGYPAKAFTTAREATRRSRAEVPGEEELAVGRGRRRRRRTMRRRK